MKDFRQLKVWQKGLKIAIETYRFCATLPKIEQFTLSSQMTRAATSISANIAKGSSRSSEREYGRFIEIALGSSFELETHLLVAQATSMGDQSVCRELLTSLSEEQKMLASIKKSLNIKTLK